MLNNKKNGAFVYCNRRKTIFFFNCACKILLSLEQQHCSFFIFPPSRTHTYAMQLYHIFRSFMEAFYTIHIYVINKGCEHCLLLFISTLFDGDVKVFNNMESGV